MAESWLGPDGEVYSHLSQREQALLDAAANSQAERDTLQAQNSKLLKGVEEHRKAPTRELRSNPENPGDRYAAPVWHERDEKLWDLLGEVGGK